MKTGFEPVEISEGIFIPANRILRIASVGKDVFVHYIGVDGEPFSTYSSFGIYTVTDNWRNALK